MITQDSPVSTVSKPWEPQISSSQSPFGWSAIYDILLRALTLQRRTLRDPTAQAIAYADDLLSISSTQACLQQHADLISAFAQILELDLAHTKFRAYVFSYHRPMLNNPQRLLSLSESTMSTSLSDKQAPSHT